MSINVKKMGHVAIMVDDVEKAANFYNEVFGFDIIYIFEQWGLVRKNKEDIAFIKRGTKHPPHFGLRVGTRDEVNKTYEKLRDEGIKILREPELHKDDSYSFFMEDPDGNAIEIIYDPNVA